MSIAAGVAVAEERANTTGSAAQFTVTEEEKDGPLARYIEERWDDAPLERNDGSLTYFYAQPAHYG